MMTFTNIEGGVCAAKGFIAGGLHCGIRKNRSKRDLGFILAEKSCAAAGVYTTNKVKGAPVLVTMKHMAGGKARAVIVNSGNANTCTADGEAKAGQMCALMAETFNIPSDEVIVASTGVIGQILPIEPIIHGVKKASAILSAKGSNGAAEAIMTTDLNKKMLAIEFTLGGKTVRMGGIAKGSGMIHPNMATMLCFVTTDAAISPAMLQKALSAVSADTFNMVSVDGDTSTSDMFTVMASGLAGNAEITEENGDYNDFCQALFYMGRFMSREIARDGEGATKLVTCSVVGASDADTAKVCAKSVICSSLVKAAMFGADANWGRVLCAIGYTPCQVDIKKIDVFFRSAKGSIQVCEKSAGIDFSEQEAKAILLEKEVEIFCDFHDGSAKAEAWGCDLTYDYVKINGDYRT